MVTIGSIKHRSGHLPTAVWYSWIDDQAESISKMVKSNNGGNTFKIARICWFCKALLILQYIIYSACQSALNQRVFQLGECQVGCNRCWHHNMCTIKASTIAKIIIAAAFSLNKFCAGAICWPCWFLNETCECSDELKRKCSLCNSMKLHVRCVFDKVSILCFWV